jgi:tetratricopeptide (TPR) repeat protein
VRNWGRAAAGILDRADEFEGKFRQAFDAYGQGNYERALVLYEQCLEMRPDHPFARNDYAGTLMALRRYGEAIAVLRGLLEDYPEERKVLRGLMDCLRAAK